MNRRHFMRSLGLCLLAGMPVYAGTPGANAGPPVGGRSAVDALLGGRMAQPHKDLYWDYGHCRDRYDQAVRMGRWKGIRFGRENPIQLYNLENDIAEKNNLATEHPDVVKKIDEIMTTAVTPSDRYVVGQRYEGGPIWKKNP